MKKRFLKQINEVLDLSRKNFFGDIQGVIREQYNDASKEEIEEWSQYVEGFVKCCQDYGSILANEFKIPSLPRDEKSEREIKKFVEECKKRYPEIEERHIVGIFSAVCWLTNR